METHQQKNPAFIQCNLAPICSRLPIRVICVVRNLIDAKTDDIQKIKQYALDSNLLFETREFDSWKYRHDRANIERLPAFHIYTRTHHDRTFYPNTRPYQHILEIKNAYLKDLEKRSTPRKPKFLVKFIEYFKQLGKRRTKLDQATFKNTIQNSSNSFRNLEKPTKEWE